ncbi:SDR family NAD(P)-dependent oxidoreductase [Segnochrobactrum spirostomi]|uniref:SDR family oxidoreductase n=1 Tax=Segnochrobactrum spirostomi TaxID=2608987 RepID=A0A6A7Y4X8_9HYPH|nr:SDR family oxidoreductase [Segnochrobactrum spirostomi]MQT13806.1 SDR family oxidoreductase [Segnochrobactrum spirostomi]
MAGRLNGRSTLVSGGADGCGAAAVRLFAAEGARVTIVDRQRDKGEALAAEIRASGGEAIFAEADVSRRAAVEAAVAAATAAFGPVTALFNHAGSIVVKPFLETTDEDYDWLMDVNVRSMFLMTRAVLPGMIAAGGGAIVCTSSISAVAATPAEVLYDTTKGAVHMFARAIGVEFRDRGVRCNAVCPGFIDTAHGRREVQALGGFGVDVSEAAMAAQQGRMCRPDEVASAALFLLSDEASFINGTHLFVDNAFTAI